MKISTKGRYALRMMLDLAIHGNSGYVALKDVAKRQGVSKKYLEQIVPLLNSADFLRTTEGGIAPVACLEQEPNRCERSGECITLDMWKGLYKVMTDYLDGITLQDLIDRQNESGFDNYSI